MRRVAVTAPDGTSWHVRVAWEPRWRALARRFGGWRRRRDDNRRAHASDAVDVVAEGISKVPPPRPWWRRADPDGDGFDLEDALSIIAVILIVASAAALLFWWVLLPLLLLAVDLLVVVVLAVAAVMSRVLLRRPWVVEATSSDGRRFTADVVGWRAALRRRDEVAESLSSGRQSADITGPAR